MTMMPPVAATSEDGFKSIVESLSRRIYDLEQTATGGSLAGGSDFESIYIGDESGGVVLDTTPPDQIPAVDITVSTGAYFNNIFADVEWSVPVDSNAVTFELDLYELEPPPVNEWLFLGTHQTSGTNYRFDNLKPNTTYQVRVIPISILGIRGEASEVIEFITGQDQTVPDAPTGVTVARGATTVVVKFDPLTFEAAPDVAAGAGLYEVQISSDSAFDPNSYLGLPGGDTLTVAASGPTTALDVTGDFDLEIHKVVIREFSNGMFQGLAAKGELDDFAWALGLAANGTHLEFYISSNGVTQYKKNSASLTTWYSEEEPLDLRVTRERVSGDLNFYVRRHGLTNWHQFTTTQTMQPGMFIRASGNDYLRIGSNVSSIGSFGGSIGSAILRRGINGTVIASPDFSAQPPGTVVFYDAQGNPWVNYGVEVLSGFHTKFTNDQIVSFSDVLLDTAWFARVRAIDSSGNVGPWSAVAGPAMAGGVIDEMMVANLNAAKITAGYINASRIEAESITVSKLRSSSLETQEIRIAGSGRIIAGSTYGANFTGAQFNAQGIRLYKNGAVMVSLDAASGNATFRGTVSASTITGSTIQGNTITGGTITGSVFSGPNNSFRIDSTGAWVSRNGAFTIGDGSSGGMAAVEGYEMRITPLYGATLDAPDGFLLRVLAGDISLQGGEVVSNNGFRATGAEGFIGYSLSISGPKNFAIPHQVLEGKELVHASLEGPENGIFYRGRSHLEGSSVFVELPDYFRWLARSEDRSVLLTPIGGWAKLYVLDVEDEGFWVYGEDSDDAEFFWEVKAIRSDIPKTEVVRDAQLLTVE